MEGPQLALIVSDAVYLPKSLQELAQLGDLEHGAQFWAPPFKKGRDLMEKIQEKGYKDD